MPLSLIFAPQVFFYGLMALGAALVAARCVRAMHLDMNAGLVNHLVQALLKAGASVIAIVAAPSIRANARRLKDLKGRFIETSSVAAPPTNPPGSGRGGRDDCKGWWRPILGRFGVRGKYIGEPARAE